MRRVASPGRSGSTHGEVLDQVDLLKEDGEAFGFSHSPGKAGGRHAAISMARCSSTGCGAPLVRMGREPEGQCHGELAGRAAPVLLSSVDLESSGLLKPLGAGWGAGRHLGSDGHEVAAPWRFDRGSPKP